MGDREVIERAIAARTKNLHALGRFIWENPETAFQEVKAHNYITAYLEEEGFRVKRNHGLSTAFRAEYGASGPVIGVMCEYDALPDIGHACGHNLIAESSVGAALAIKAVLEADANLQGKVVVFGTPAEEGGMGKELLLRKGTFDDVDVAIMAHPEARSALRVMLSARSQLRVTYRGKAAHAASAPWEGLNALDAAVGAYLNISMLRQRLEPSLKVHGIVLKAGVRNNIIPEESEMSYGIRAPTTEELLDLKTKVVACFEAAAQASGCAVTISEKGPMAKHVIPNETMSRLFQVHGESYGMTFEDGISGLPVSSSAATDMGNVSHRIPSIHPVFRIVTTAQNHTREFQEAAGKIESQETALTVAKVLALTALDILRNPQLLDTIKEEFRATPGRTPLTNGSC